MDDGNSEVGGISWSLALNVQTMNFQPITRHLNVSFKPKEKITVG